MWDVTGPAGGGTGPSAAAAGDSWDCCAGPVTRRGPDAVAAAAAGAVSGGGPVVAGLEKMEVGGHLEWAEGLEMAAEDLPHLALHRPLADQPWRSAAASGGCAGAGSYAAEQL